MFQLTALGGAQVNPTTQLKGTNTAVGTTVQTLYTVPAGKKAQVNAFSDRSVALGANTHMHFTISSINLRDMSAAELAMTDENIRGFTMNAGDTITIVGDNAGNNGTINFLITIQELPA